MFDSAERDVMTPGTKPPAAAPAEARPYKPVFSILATIIVVIAAIWLGSLAWTRYDATPWTRDARVRAYAIAITPEISGRIVSVDVHANQTVRRGQVLMRIDPSDFENALAAAQAALAADEATARMKAADASRRARLPSMAVSAEAQQNAAAAAQAAEAAVMGDKARVAQALLHLRRTVVTAPVTGTITNLTLHAGDYAHAGSAALTLIDAHDIWVTAYFEETELGRIRPGAAAKIQLLADPGRVLTGAVQGIGRGIAVSDAQTSAGGLPVVNPVYSWVRLSQRIPVHIALDRVPSGLFLAAGMSATVRIVPGHGH
ncbi:MULTISPECIES: HlyD family secretion protein [Acidiphilium]|uniref:efflux RND transporter periplasmic adaptor subunit n=1 Tax=Acidiphilium TaxID=522 RepID=UPI002580B18F|nr:MULTISPECIES: HlyD family secretion protein [Acidiphilium]HQT85519.1 HlyD family secretion protein [Acidiphilium rubrum]